MQMGSGMGQQYNPGINMQDEGTEDEGEGEGEDEGEDEGDGEDDGDYEEVN